ncbi:MAG TPA: preprotein translocase subunit SecE [Polyangiaceae bacterium]|jgi:preprotein translocase subunit SecE
MGIVEDSEKKTGDSESEEKETAADDQAETVALEPTIEPTPLVEKRPEENGPTPNAPVQLGYRRYVYAAYMAAAIAVAFLSTKVIDFAWFKTSQWKPQWFGQYVEPVDEVVVILGGLIGVAFAVYYWRNKRVRTLIEEIAEELTRVTWPTRKEVTSSTTVVILATAFSTIFFALMDQFWIWVTKHVYGS